MARYRFTATRGLHFSDDGMTPWALFKRDRTEDSPYGVAGYVFETDDDAVAERVRAVTGYGIVDKTPPEPKPVRPAK